MSNDPQPVTAVPKTQTKAEGRGFTDRTLKGMTPGGKFMTPRGSCVKNASDYVELD